MAAPAKLAALRQLLAERSPSRPRPSGPALATGIPAIDDASAGGLPAGAITEVVCAGPSRGSHLLLGRLLAGTRGWRGRVALVDATDCFDPQSHPADLLAHLLWVRCREAATALAAADLLLRDANLALVILDLRDCAAPALRRVPDTLWYRLQRAAEQASLPFVVISPRPLAASARLRFELGPAHRLRQLDSPRAFLGTALPAALQRHRHAAAG